MSDRAQHGPYYKQFLRWLNRRTLLPFSNWLDDWSWHW
jgi:hypothetical protein